MEGYSDICTDLKTYLNRETGQCIPCEKPIQGYEITPNCGYDDHGGRHELPTTQCKANFFNDGSKTFCQPCTQCPDGFHTVKPCNSTADTQCQDPRNWTTEFPARETTTTSQHVSTFFIKAPTEGSSLTPHATTTPSTFYPDPNSRDVPWESLFAILIFVMLVVLSTCIIYMKRKRGQRRSLTKPASYMNAGFSALSALSGNDQKDILSPDIVSLPLQTVLDNLDVLEELVILLDPESHGVKNTKHLASHCSFTSTWITYTYSMKDSKSPLKAVLEGVISRHPDWTVGHLAKLLRQMERNDAIVVLAKLRYNQMDVAFH